VEQGSALLHPQLRQLKRDVGSARDPREGGFWRQARRVVNLPPEPKAVLVRVWADGEGQTRTVDTAAGTAAAGQWEQSAVIDQRDFSLGRS
jgi:hypothetical protein